MTDEMRNLLRETFEYSMANVHTSFPGVVVAYDAKTRRATIQPSLRRKLPSGLYVDFPQLPDVPVVFPSTKNCVIIFPLEKDDEVEVRICERSLDKWRDSGGAGIEDSDPRRFNLMDCYAYPGLQAVDFCEAPEDGLSIIYKDFKTNVVDDKAVLEFKEIKVETDGKDVKSSWKKHDMTGDVNIKGEVKIEGNTEITGGSFLMKGQVSPTTGPLCAIPNCLFTGAPHTGDRAVNT